MKIYKSLSVNTETKSLLAITSYGKPTSKKTRCATTVRIVYGKKELGKAVLGGKWMPTQALNEFLKFSEKFGYEGEENEFPTIQTVTINLGPLCVAIGTFSEEILPYEAIDSLIAFPDNWEKGEAYESAISLGLLNRKIAA